MAFCLLFLPLSGQQRTRIDMLPIEKIIQQAFLGNPVAQDYLGFLYFNGERVRQHRDSALYWIEKSAASGFPPGISDLRYLLSDSSFLAGMESTWEMLPADSALDKARFYYSHRAPVAAMRILSRKDLADHPDALALLADAYAKGEGVAYDRKKSNELFLKSAEGGNPGAQFIIAELLDIFPDMFDSRDAKDARYWYEKASEGGVHDAVSAEKAIFGVPE